MILARGPAGHPAPYRLTPADLCRWARSWGARRPTPEA
jgi:hypothetical protein